MAKFANSFSLFGESECDDLMEIINVVDEKAKTLFLAALKKEKDEAKKKASEEKRKKKEVEKNN